MRGLRFFLLVLSGIISIHVAVAQQDSLQQPETTRTVPVRPQITIPVQQRPVVVRDSNQPRINPPDSATLAAAKQLRDSLHTDSLKKAIAASVDTSTYAKYLVHPYLSMQQPPVFKITDYHLFNSKDELFYLMVGVVFCLAFIRAGFPKYFRNLFVVFFQTNIRQKQTRDQLLQDNFASLLINLLFFISAGLYITLLLRYNGWTLTSFWILALASALALVLIYVGKYLFLLFAGWVFNAREAAGSYIFLVFMVNKVMGVILVPFLLLLAFATSTVAGIAVTISFGIVALMFMYRYFVSFNAIRSRLKVHVLHFFLYLCAVEVLPLLLIYKLLINYIDGAL